ncbi:tRNA (N(6)-L-threonylcarbamoyladenosine(37)-C(2))-methylthiotransferase MtaB [Candidatus Peregrinibacteria bacterium]|nr:tRNA (N(6)-L-threonylcarbamoyladenosine(37)-C(2))-methylthiotransferase MtaB [Candidatus Peregrinibacteria bacterium]
MKIIIKTLGCKANRYESDRIFEKFGNRFVIADAQFERLEKADVIIVNTCTVTENADRKSRQAIQPLKKLYPSAKVIVFGCGANTDEKGYKQLKNVDFVVQKPEELDKLLIKLGNSKKSVFCNDKGLKEISRTRALVKIQDGCNNFCSYCIIPFARGREKSRSLKEIINEVNNKLKNGYKEIVITGINIGQWKENGNDLADLIEMILKETKAERLRLSSIEPQNFSNKFLELFKNPHFCPHLHISLQSGSDEILQKMRRHYDTALFTKMVKNLRKAVPHFGITTDIIVGFPGETEKLFKETLEYIKKIKFGKIHIFPYSKRKGTLAALMPDQIPQSVKLKRCRILADLEKKLRINFYKKNIGRTEEIIIENPDEKGVIKGFTSNYIKTRIKNPGADKINGTIQKVTLNKLLPSGEVEGILKA